MSAYRVAFADTAEEGLLNIVDYIALDNPVRAVSFVGELTVSVRKMLSAFPYSGKVVEDLNLMICSSSSRAIALHESAKTRHEEIGKENVCRMAALSCQVYPIVA